MSDSWSGPDFENSSLALLSERILLGCIVVYCKQVPRFKSVHSEHRSFTTLKTLLVLWSPPGLREAISQGFLF